jgi:hypothetical protein
MNNCLYNISVNLTNGGDIFEAVYKIINGNIYVDFKQKQGVSFNQAITIGGTVSYGDNCAFPFSRTVYPPTTDCDFFNPTIAYEDNSCNSFNPSVIVKEDECGGFEPSIVYKEDECGGFKPSIVYKEDDCLAFAPSIICAKDDCCSCDGVRLFSKD